MGARQNDAGAKKIRCTLDLVQFDDATDRYRVSIPGSGVPDFFILANTGDAAKKALYEYLYNELDGKEPIALEDLMLL